MTKIKVLIADDHAIVRTGLASLLGTSKSIEVAGEAFDGDDAVSYFDDMEKTFKEYVGNDGKKLDVKRINSETLHVDFENSDGLKGKNIYYLEIIKVF